MVTEGLTPRELEVVEAIRAGARSYSAIARVLDPPCATRTVEAHLSSIYRNLPGDIEPDAPPFWRLVICVSGYVSGHLLTDDAE